MKTYYKNGIMQDTDVYLNFIDDFCIQEIPDTIEKYSYKGDSIRNELDNELVVLYDKLRDLLFPDTDKYYEQIDSAPIFVQEAGYNSDCALSSEQLLELIDVFKDNIPDLYKHLYLVDIQFLISTIQNLLDSMNYAFTNYYVQISDIEVTEGLKRSDNTVLMLNSYEARCICSLVETYFTKAYSILDMLTKIEYEFENKYEVFDSFKKTKSANILWGHRKQLNIEKENTVFGRSNTVKLIESLRNEVVHNGSLEQHPRVFIKYADNEIVERFILIPDYIDGVLVTTKSRKHFFSQENKVNDILPTIHFEYLNEILSTVKYLNKRPLQSRE